MHKFIAGIAAIALAASLAHAQPGRGEGKGPPAAERGPDRTNERAERGPKGRDADNNRGNQSAEAPRQQRGRGNDAREERRDRDRDQARDRSDRRDERREAARIDRRIDTRDYRDVRRDGRRDRTSFARLGRDARSVIDGCPPGLARLNNGCMPPGLARQRAAYYRPAYFGYPGLGDGRYHYSDGYLYRLGAGDSVVGFIPLLGGALGIGNAWPSFYEPAPLSPYYVEYFNLGDAPDYRYADDVIYRVDPGSSAITSIAALLTGDDFAVGQPMPSGYDVYNVPYGYRDRYYDTDDANYRYADGYLYQVDPTSQLIAAVIELIA